MCSSRGVSEADGGVVMSSALELETCNKLGWNCVSPELTVDLAGRLGKSGLSLLFPKSKRPKIKSDISI